LTEFEYDANGNMTRRDDANLDFVEWTYDALDRPLTQRINGAATDDVAWSYDTGTNGKGLVHGRIDRAGTYLAGTYDFLGRPLVEHYVAGGFNHDFHTTYTNWTVAGSPSA
jgi:YD repeat-containing protein